LTPTAARARSLELVVASVLTGVFGAITIYVSEHQVGLEKFAPLAQLWTMWALLAASITFSVQQWVARSVLMGADRTALVRRLSSGVLPLAVATTIVCRLLSDVWFDDGWGFPALAGVLVLGTAVNGFGRGVAATVGSPRQLAAIVVGENLIRLVLLVPLVVFDAALIWYGCALIAGFGVNVVALRTSSTLASHDGAVNRPRVDGLVTAGLVGVIGYATMFGGPLLLAAGGVGGADVSALFLVVTIARVPFVVMLGVVPGIATHLEKLAAASQANQIWQLSVRVAGAGGVVAAVVGGIAAAVAGPTIGRGLGTNASFGGIVYALVGASSVLALAALVLTMAALALGRRTWLAATWAIPVVVAASGLAVGGISSVEHLAWGLLVVETVVVLALLAVVSDAGARRIR
jgi:hypothetical protein